MDDKTIQKLLGFLGIARKAGRLVCGTELVTQAVRNKKCCAVLCAADISPNTEKRLTDSCSFHRVPLRKTDIPMEAFSRALGKSSPVAAVAVTEDGFGRAVLSYFS